MSGTLQVTAPQQFDEHDIQNLFSFCGDIKKIDQITSDGLDFTTVVHLSTGFRTALLLDGTLFNGGVVHIKKHEVLKQSEKQSLINSEPAQSLPRSSAPTQVNAVPIPENRVNNVKDMFMAIPNRLLKLCRKGSYRQVDFDSIQ